MTGLRRRLAALVGSFLVIVAGLARTFYFAGRPDQLITIIPDDAFYYLRLAHNRVAVGTWTFDQVSPTSGFHLLYGYLLAGTEWIFGPVLEDWQHSAVVISVLSTFAVALAAYWVVRTGQRLYGEPAAWWALVVLLVPSSIQLLTMMMESPLVVLAAAGVFALGASDRQPSVPSVLGLVLAGWLAGLSRADFGLWPGMLWLVMMLCRDEKVRKLRLSLILVGAVVAVITTLVHSYLWTSHLAPSSALVKLQWSLEAGMGSFGGDFGLPALILLAFGFAAYRLAAHRPGKLSFEPFALASALTVVGYMVIFYGIGSRGVQPWYQASFLVPLSVSAMAVGAVVSPRLSKVIAILLVSVVAIASLMATTTQRWPWQAGMYHAAQRLVEKTDGKPVGSWNAGILAVVSGLPVTNLDGLVDDRAAAASVQGVLYDYLRAREIEYIADTAESLGWTESGKEDPRIAQCYESLGRLSNSDDPADLKGPTTLFRLREACR